MNTTLARWLEQHRAALLPRWLARLNVMPTPVAAMDEYRPDLVAHPSERDLLVASIYDGLVAAADGDFAPLSECLRLLRALRTHEGESELCDGLDLTFHLRRVLWDALFDDATLNGSQRPLLEDAERLIEHTALTLASNWTSAAEAVRQQLQHSEHFALSLIQSAEQADQIAVQLHNLNVLASELSASLDPAALIATAGSRLATTLSVAHVSIWLCDARRDLYVAQSWGEADLTDYVIDPALADDLIVTAYQQQQTLFVREPIVVAQGRWYLDDCAVLAVPLLSQDVLIGMIVVQDSDPEKLSHTQQAFVSSVANQSATALQNARLYAEVRGFNAALEQRITERTRELQTERDMLSTLNQIALEVSSTLDLDMLLESCLHALATLIGVEHGSIMLIEQDTDHLVDRAVLGRDRSQLGFTRFPMGQGIAGWVAQQRKPALVPDVGADSRWLPLPASEQMRKQIGAMALVPLIVQGEVIGVMSLSHDQVGYFNQDHMRLLGASAGAIAMGINNARLYEEILSESVRKGDMLQNERRATTQSAAILQSLSDGVIVCDIDGHVLTANPAAERVLDTPLESLIVLPLSTLFQTLLGERAKEVSLDSVLIGRGSPISSTTNFQRGRRMIRVTVDPVATEREEVIGAVAVFRDITREVESDRLKDEFIGAVSHEVRTPMTSIKGYTQLLSMGSLGPVNDQQREFLQTIYTNAERMISIINDVLDITKIEAGSIEMEMRPLHVAEALGNVVMDLRNRIQARGHELQIHIPPGLSLVRADAKRFDQILGNLISNANKYTRPGGKIVVEARDVTYADLPESVRDQVRNKRYVLVSIADTGIGIAPEQQAFIFGRFSRIESPLSVEAGGTGMGLALVRPLVQMLGGAIWLESEPGVGSTFSFIVPTA